ncbi:trp operon repressor [Sansalvadorimonas verongulae]|uniref:trp operon repressor n=1 Tax=Sansalvadorimonas verongulae TaxID=2172824 RepID=UPI0012BD5630|nr:trp operon repressor [Sansalvadorimonas verongulae]MTI12387.1 trp operon repressor [Sansalvadorimonas verongulae]
MSEELWPEVLGLIQNQPDSESINQVLEVLLTPEEQSDIASRLAIMRALLEGSRSQRAVAADLGVSIAKITRGSNYLKRLSLQEKKLIDPNYD